MSAAAVIGDGPVATTLRQRADLPSGAVFLVFLRDTSVLAEQSTAAVHNGAAAIVVVVDWESAALDRHLLLASIEPLARQFAPATRIAAIDADRLADAEDIAAAAIFLAQSEAITGQVIRVSARAA